ncbi:MMPL family transporter [Nocardioides marmorisolisilvae]|uniref:MMPL family transporter n=1 Tax=Nocardioides marmorisolisilvae TaxID=1542737 RepID=A0A3N0DZF3_9ACTN|nr:MMPL family transporter [Nocardioides marmorisolisilvae]RNL80977.1 MMPL family transporter [Nocardioides marmorisolisilvae]
MFAALGRFVTRFRWFVVAAWLIAAVVVAIVAPGLSSTQDESAFLPKHYESIKAAQIQQDDFPQQSQPGAILVFDRTDGGKLTATDALKATKVVDSLNQAIKDKKVLHKVFAGAAIQPPSENKLVQIGVAGLAKNATGFDDAAMKAAKELRKEAKPLVKGTGLQLQMTGAAPQQLDAQDSSQKTLEIVFGATIFLIVGLLALIFRSVLICLLPLLTVGIATPISNGLVAWANNLFDLKADSSITVIMVVVMYGVGTDYILFLLFRYRERLRLGEDPGEALIHAMERAGEAIASAGGAVIVAFLALILSSLSIFRSIGPSLAIAVGVTLLAALTLVPALVSLFGKALFWPSKNWRKEPEAARFAAIGNQLGKRPAVFAAASGLALAVLAIFALGFNPAFDFNSSLPKNVESTQALTTLEKGLPSGATDPATVMLTSKTPLNQGELATFQQKLTGAKGAAQVSPAVLSPSGKAAAFSVVLKDDPGSDAAIANVKGPIRAAAHAAAPAGTQAYVGGTTSVFVDMQKAMNRDYSVIFPVAAAIILLILALLLRSLVAPLFLMVSVGLGFAATLGATVLVIQHIKGDSGLIFLLPIYIYLFVVALGTDYNILMIARLRDEARAGRTPHDAAAEAVKHAGPTIAAAGLILAGTFATFMLGGNSFIVSLGFALSFGIFVAAFIMSMFFTPALTALIGHAAWWPGHGDETDEEHFARTGEHYTH